MRVSVFFTRKRKREFLSPEDVKIHDYDDGDNNDEQDDLIIVIVIEMT